MSGRAASSCTVGYLPYGGHQSKALQALIDRWCPELGGGQSAFPPCGGTFLHPPPPHRTCQFPGIRRSIRLLTQGATVRVSAFIVRHLHPHSNIVCAQPFSLTASLRRVASFPGLRLLRRLRPTPGSSRRLAHTQRVSQMWFPRSHRSRPHGAVGSAFTPGLARCRARSRGTQERWSAERRFGGDEAGRSDHPRPPPSSSPQRVVCYTTLLTAVSRVTVAPLWLARPIGGGSHHPALSGELQTLPCLGSSACPRSHLFTPYRAPILEALDRRASWRTHRLA